MIAAIEPQSSITNPSPQTGSRRDFIGSQELLRGAAQSLANPGPGDHAAGAGQSSDHEVGALRSFIEGTGLWLEGKAGHLFPNQGMNVAFCVVAVALCCWLNSCERSPTSNSATMSLSAEGLDPNDKSFVFQLADRVAAYADIDDTPLSVARLRALPEHWRYIEPLIYYHNEVNNGGHHQYFWNSQGVYRHLVAEGLKYYRATDFEQNYLKALDLYQPSLYEVSQGATYEAFDKAYQEDRFDTQDRRFYTIKPDLDEVIATAVRQNIDKYQ